MLMINLLRAGAILAGLAVYQFYTGELLSVDEGLVVFLLGFFGLTLLEVAEDSTVDYFNRKSPRT